MDFSFPADRLLPALGLLLLGTILLVAFLRYRLHHARPSDRDGRTKLAGADAFRLSGTFYRYGLVAALAVALLTLNFSRVEPEYDYVINYDEITELDVAPPITRLDPPPPPPPPPPPTIEVSDEVLEDTPAFVDNFVDPNEAIVPPAPPSLAPTAPPPPPPPPPAPEISDAPLIIAERMPVFGTACREIDNAEERRQCSDRALMEFIYKEIKYPAIARENGVQGMVVVSFTVERDGSVSDIVIARDQGAGLGAEGARVVKLINERTDRFEPGRQRGKAVRVRFNLPVKFKLE